MTIPQSLVEALANQRAIPFIGSGVSLSVKDEMFPTWPRLLEKMAVRLEGEVNDEAAQIVRLYCKKNQLYKAATEAFSELGKSRFNDEMRKCFQTERPDDVDLSAVEALWALEPPLVVTTNYDSVLQWGNSRAIPLLNSQRSELANVFTSATPDCPVVWYLHGHVSHADSLILAPAEYDSLYRDAVDPQHAYAAARQQLTNLLSNFPLLFIGFGLQDRYVMESLRTVLEIFDDNLRPSFALLKHGEVEPREIWKQHKVQIIEFDNYGPPLVAKLRELVALTATEVSASSGAKRDAAVKPIVPAAYTNWLQKRCGDIDLLGLRVKHGQAVRLNQVYTPLTTSARGDDDDVAAGELHSGKPRIPHEEQKRAQLLLNLLDEHSLYVSGNPGSGKSTFCRWVAWLVCSRRMPPADVQAPDGYDEFFPESLADRLPVMVRLRDFWRNLPRSPKGRTMTSAQLLDALCSWLEEEDSPDVDGHCLLSHLDHGSALLILDGVDEVPSQVGEDAAQWYPRELLLSALSMTIGKWERAGNRLLLTSRPYGLNEEQRQRLDLRHAPIDGLDEPLQQVLTRRWFYRLDEDHDQGLKTAGQMIDHIRGQQGLVDLARNPLLLSSMCIIYDEGKRLPQDRYELYDRIVDTVLHKRYPPVKERVSVIRGRLAVVALGMHTGDRLAQQRTNPQAVASDAEIDIFLQAYRQTDGATERGWTSMVAVREDLLTQTGLLVARDDQRAMFYHLSFQEFLAAERLFVLRGTDADGFLDLFIERAPAAGWRITLAFVFGSLITKFNPQAGIGLLHRWADHANFSRLVSDDTTPTDEEAWNPAVVMGECLEILTGRGVDLPPKLKSFYQQLAKRSIDRESPLKVRFAIATILGRLGDPRIVTDLRDRAAYVELPADVYRFGDERKKAKVAEAFLISRFLVTNSQYAVFIGEGGYGNREWWSDAGWKWLRNEEVSEPLYWRNAKWNSPNQPVVTVSFWEAEAFCKWAGGYLPTERQWEAAARGPDGYVYPWGDEWGDDICNSFEADLNVTSPVGIFPRSKSKAFGLHDMAGNVWEWCQDGEEDSRVLRGGSFLVDALDLRSADRSWNPPSARILIVGFRVARTVTPEPP